jgi:hypothetical protein
MRSLLLPSKNGIVNIQIFDGARFKRVPPNLWHPAIDSCTAGLGLNPKPSGENIYSRRWGCVIIHTHRWFGVEPQTSGGIKPNLLVRRSGTRSWIKKNKIPDAERGKFCLILFLNINSPR